MIFKLTDGRTDFHMTFQTLEHAIKHIQTTVGRAISTGFPVRLELSLETAPGVLQLHSVVHVDATKAEVEAGMPQLSSGPVTGEEGRNETNEK